MCCMNNGKSSLLVQLSQQFSLMAKLQCISKHCQPFPIHHTVNPMLCDANSVVCNTPLKTQLYQRPADAQTEACLISNWSIPRQQVRHESIRYP